VSKAGNVESCPKCGGLIHLPGKSQGSGCAAGLSLVAIVIALAWWTAGLIRPW
jgi:hypothetical protein